MMADRSLLSVSIRHDLSDGLARLPFEIFTDRTTAAMGGRHSEIRGPANLVVGRSYGFPLRPTW